MDALMRHPAQWTKNIHFENGLQIPKPLHGIYWNSIQYAMIDVIHNSYSPFFTTSNAVDTQGTQN